MLFCSGDLDLDVDPVTFIYELDLYPFQMYPQTENELSRLLKVITLQTYIQATDTKTVTSHFAGGNKTVQFSLTHSV